MEKVKKALKWVWANSKLVLIVLLGILFTIFIIWWGNKNRKIRELETKLAILKAKITIEKLVAKYETTMSELAELRSKDKKVNEELQSIEKSLEEKLKPDMTAEEIAEKFKELGLCPLE